MRHPLPSVQQSRVAVANSHVFSLSIFVDDWQLPAGAFGEASGPI